MELNKGMKLIYKGYETTPSVEIKAVMLPGHPEYDGAAQGISFRWLKKRGKPSFFFTCNDTQEFLSDCRFANLVPADSSKTH